MAILQITAPSFSSTSRVRGDAYYERGLVHPIKAVAGSQAVFNVTGTMVYTSSIKYSPEKRELSLQCNCPHFEDGNLCKHLWASVLKSDELDIFFELGPRSQLDIKRGDVKLDNEMNGKKTDPNTPTLPTGPKTLMLVNEKREPPPPLPKVSSWQQSIQKAEKKLASERREVPYRYRQEKVENKKIAHFGLDLKQSLEESSISLRFLVQERLKNGNLGVVKQAELSHASIPHFADEKDRTALLMLLGKTRLGGHYYSPGGGVMSAVVSQEYASEILSAVSATGRFYLMKNYDRYYQSRNERFDLEPYRYCENTWSLQLSLHRSGKEFQLSGCLTDGKEMRQPKDIIGRIGQILLFKDFVAQSTIESSLAWLEVFKNGKEISLPEGEVNAFLEYYYGAGASAQLNLPNELQFEEVPSVFPKCRFTISTVKESAFLQGDLEFNYAGNYISTSFQGEKLVDVKKREMIRRNVDEESKIKDQFRSLNPQAPIGRMQDIDTDGIFHEREFLPLVEKALSFGWEVVAHAKNVRLAKDFNISVTSGIDWFDVNAEFNFDGFTESLPQLIAAIKSGQRLVQLGDGTFGMLPESWLKKFGPIAEMGLATESGFRLNKVQALFLSASLEENDKFKADRKFNSLKTILDDFKDAKAADPGSAFKGRLRAYQKHGLSWLLTIAKHEIGGILADDMGLGKTIQVLALLSHFKDGKGKRLPSLIVAPKSLVFNWIKESEKFTPTLKILNFTGSNRKENFNDFEDYDVILTTYQSLRIDIEELRKKTFNFFILDEAHFVKNPEAQASMACRLISAKRKISLSGTPVENSLSDLFSILSIVNPGLISDTQAQKWAGTSDPDSLKLLARALRPFILRRSKEQVLKDLPTKSEQVIYCELSPSERRKYTELKAYYWSQLSGKFKEKGLARSKIEVLEALLRLRQAACHQGLLDTKSQIQTSAKFEVLFDQLDTIIKDGHKALVFSQFTTLLGLLRKRLDEKGLRYEYLDGKTSDRQARVQNFQTDPEIPLFLLSLKAGGVGLNLTAADYVFVLDPWWNPAAESQAIDRAHRIGQKNKVFAYKLIAKDTVEEKILELQKSKKELATAIFSQEASLLKNLKIEDLQALFM